MKEILEMQRTHEKLVKKRELKMKALREEKERKNSGQVDLHNNSNKI